MTSPTTNPRTSQRRARVRAAATRRDRRRWTAETMYPMMPKAKKNNSGQPSWTMSQPAGGVRRDALPEFLGAAIQHLDDVVDAARHAAGEVVRLEARRDRVLDDVFGDRVGQRAFQPVADLDADLALVRRMQQQHAVVLAALAELPAAEQSVGVVLDRIAVQRLHRRDDDLVRGLALRARRAWRAATSRVAGIEHAGIVDHAPRTAREIPMSPEALATCARDVGSALDMRPAARRRKSRLTRIQTLDRGEIGFSASNWIPNALRRRSARAPVRSSPCLRSSAVTSTSCRRGASVTP